jgi:F-type H+-transporting ATPase subunit delta
MDTSRLKGTQVSLSGRYARALFEVASEQSETDAIMKKLDFFELSLKQGGINNIELSHLSKSEFQEIIQTCSEKLQWPAYLKQFFVLLHESKRLTILSQIISVFQSLNDNLHGRLPVHLSLPTLPTMTQKKRIEAKIVSIFGKEMRYEYEAMPSLLGGFVATIDDTLQIDASLSTSLDTLHKSLTDFPLKGAA